MLPKLPLAAFTFGLLCITGSHGSIDRVIDRMMERMFVESARMSKNIANVQLQPQFPRGFWATNRIPNYPSYVNSHPRYATFQSVPQNTPSRAYGVSNNVYAPKYTINRSIQLPAMPQFARPPMAFPQSNMVPPMFRKMFAPTRTPQNQFVSVRGPVLQVNLKVKPPVNKNFTNKRENKVNITAEIEKESVGEIVASWNTEMKEVSISGSKNETKIKTFKNNGNIHSHLGTGVEGSAHILKLRRGQMAKVQTVPEPMRKKTIERKHLSEKLPTPKVVDDTMRYKLEQDQGKSFESANTMPPMINLLPRQQRNVIKDNF